MQRVIRVLTYGPLCRLFELWEQMCHRLVQMMFCEGLGIIHSQCRDKCDDHLADILITVGLEFHDLLRSVLDIVPHKL